MEKAGPGDDVSHMPNVRERSRRLNSTTGDVRGIPINKRALVRATAHRQAACIDREVLHRVARVLETRQFHAVILGLLLLDVVIIVVELVLAFLDESSCERFVEGNPELQAQIVEFHEAEEVLHWVTVSILSIFVVENLLKLIVFGHTYFTKHFIHLFDVSVVVISLILTLVLTGAASDAAGLVVIFRSWHVVRLVDAVVLAVDHKLHEQLEEAEHQADENVMLKAEVEQLRLQLELVVLASRGSKAHTSASDAV